MNPYTPLLNNAVRAATVNTRATRDFIYHHARQTLLTHLESGEDVSSPAQIQIEMRRLDDAIAMIEETMSEDSGHLGARLSQVDRLEASTSAPAVLAPAIESEAADEREPAAANRSGRMLPPLKMSGLVLNIVALLSNPYFLLASLGLGIYIGLTSKTITEFLAPIADLYIELLKMVLIPFMISAIVVSLSRLFGSETMRRHLGSVLAVFTIGIAAVALLGLATAIVLAPGGDLTTDARQTMGQLINRSPYAVDLEVSLNEPVGDVKEARSGQVFDRVIPDNIFRALTAGDNLKIVFFAIAFGIGLGSLRLNRGDGLRIALLSAYDVCTQLIAWVNMLLPVALCAMVAKQVSTVGTSQLVAMIRFTFGFGMAAVVVCLCSVLVIAWASKTGVLRTLRAIREPLLLAVATRSSITCIPSAMTALVDKLGYDRVRVEFLLPLGITLFRFGPVLYYAFSTMFVAQLYGIALSPGAYALVFAGAILTGLASAGTTGVLTISLLGVIFQPLGLPLEAALALLVTIDPVIDIFRTAAIVIANCAAVAIVYRHSRVATLDGVDARRENALI